MMSTNKDRNRLKSLYNEYVENGGVISPMNTETCRRYLQNMINVDVQPEDVLRLFYDRLNEMKVQKRNATTSQ